MLQQTFPDPAVAARVNQQFVPVLIDADEQAALVQTLNVDSTPTVMVISPDQKVVGRIVGFQSAAQLDARLAAIQPVATRPLIKKASVGAAPFIRAPRPSPPTPHVPVEKARDTLAAAKAFSGG
jgi:Thioredoxin-like domain